MQEVWDIIVEMYEYYAGNGMYSLLTAVACVYLLVTFRKKKENLYFVLTALLSAFIYVCPWTANIIMENCIEANVYWRLLWLIPDTAVIALAGASLLDSIKWKWLKGILLVVLVAVIGASGSFVYANEDLFASTDNIYHLPSPVVEVCDMIEEDAEEQGIEEVLVLVPNDMLCYIRQYQPSFKMPYGRNALRNPGKLTKNQQGLYSQMGSDEADAETLNYLLRREGCNYFVWDRDDELRDEFSEEWEMFVVGDAGDCRIFRIEDNGHVYDEDLSY